MKHKILLTVSDSETSEKAARYLGEFACDCKEFEITLLHIISSPPSLLEHRGSEDPDEEERLGEELRARRKNWVDESEARVEKEIFAPLIQILKERGFKEGTNKILTKVATSAHPDVALSIVDEVQSSGYDTVVIGKHAISRIGELLTASVAAKVVHKIRECGIWIVE